MVTIENLRICEILSELSDSELEEILPCCREERREKGTIMFREGDEAEAFYILQKGEISIQYVICPQPDYCQDARIVLTRPGDYLGWSSLVKPRRMTASAYCVTDVELVAIDAQGMNQLMEQDSHIGFTIMKELAGSINKRLKEAKGLTFQRIMGSL